MTVKSSNKFCIAAHDIAKINYNALKLDKRLHHQVLSPNNLARVGQYICWVRSPLRVPQEQTTLIWIIGKQVVDPLGAWEEKER